MLILVSGGSASGKSRYAEELVVRTQAGERIYVATMQVWDAESRKRVERHRAMRAGKGFRTVERPVRLGEMPVPEGAVVLLEDLSNLAANEWFDGGDRAGVPERVLTGIRLSLIHISCLRRERRRTRSAALCRTSAGRESAPCLRRWRRCGTRRWICSPRSLLAAARPGC